MRAPVYREYLLLIFLSAKSCVRELFLRDHAIHTSSNLWYDMQTAIDALEKLLEMNAAASALRLSDGFSIWELIFGFMKLLVNRDLSAARKDKHLQSAIAHLMLKVASIPASGAAASNSEGNAKLVVPNVHALLKRVGWNSDLLSPSYAGSL